MWIARDEYGDLWLFEEEPFRVGDVWKSLNGNCQVLIDDVNEE